MTTVPIGTADGGGPLTRRRFIQAVAAADDATSVGITTIPTIGQ